MNIEYILIIDIGNSYTKIGIYDIKKEKGEKIILFKTKQEINFEEIRKKTKEIKKYKISHCILGSVVPTINQKFFDFVVKNYNVFPYLINNSTKVSFILNERSKNEIGNDLLALCEFCSNISKNIIGFSFGTASAAIVLIDNVFVGASISPGLTFSMDRLLVKAPLLKINEINNKNNQITGIDTKQALEAGINNFRRGLVLGIVYFYKQLYPDKKIDCLLTGGDSFSIDPIDFDYLINDEAILLGLKKIYILNMKK